MMIYNIGLKPEIIGRTKEGFPLVIQPGRKAAVPDQLAKKLLKEKKNLVDPAGYKAKKEKDKKDKKIKEESK